MNPFKKALTKLIRHYVPHSRDGSLAPASEPGPEGKHASVDGILAILDEAWAGQPARLFGLYRDIMADAHLQTAFATRKLALLGDPMRILPYDRADAADIVAARVFETAWADLSGKREALTHLLDASLYPVSVVRKSFKPSTIPGLRFEIRALDPVEYRRIDLSNPDGRLRLYDVSPEGHVLGTSRLPDPRSYIVHRGHLLTSLPDRWGGPMRAALFWWLFKTQSRAFWARFLERFGSPFIVGKYDRDQEGAQSELAYAFREATRIFGLVIPTDSSVDLVQSASSQTGDAFRAFHEVANGELSKLVIGQTMTMDAQAGGLGGQQAVVMDRVRGDFRAFDSMALAETLRDQLFRQFCSVNQLPGRAPNATWGEDADQSGEIGKLLSDLANAGLQPTDEAVAALSLRVGFPLVRAGLTGRQRDVAETIQKVYLGVGSVVSSDEARSIVNDAGGALALPGPAFAPKAPAAFAAGDPATDRPEVERIIGTASADLSRAFRGAFAPVALAVRQSTDPDDLERRLRALYADGLPASRLETLIQEALLAFSANAMT